MLMTVLACQSVLTGQLAIRSSSISSNRGTYSVSSPAANNRNKGNGKPEFGLNTANSHNFAKFGGLRAFVTSQQAVDEDCTAVCNDEKKGGKLPHLPLPGADVQKVDLAFSEKQERKY